MTVLDVRRDFGAVDGADATRPILNALAAAKAAGGGELLFDGVFRCATPVGSGFNGYAFDLTGDNITLRGVGGNAQLVSEGMPYFLRVGQKQAPGPLRTILPAERGSDRVTLATPAQVSDFAPGDYVLVQTGQTTSTGNTYDAEINRVSLVDPAGVVVLRKPLAKPYQQENYLTGSAGMTAVGGAGTPAPLGISKIYPSTNLEIRDLTITHPGASALLSGGVHVAGLTVGNIDAVCGSSFQSMSSYTDAIIQGNRIHISDPSDVEHYFASTAWGCSDVEIAGNVCSSRGLGFLHIHEGSSRVRAHHNVIACRPDVKNPTPAISVVGRGYGITVDHNQITGGGTDRACYVAPGVVDAVVTGNSAYLRQGNGGFRVAADGAVVRDNIATGSTLLYGTYAEVDAARTVAVPACDLAAPATSGATARPDALTGSWDVKAFTDSTTRTVVTYQRIPEDWLTYDVDLQWTAAATTGKVLWSVRVTDIDPASISLAEQSKATSCPAPAVAGQIVTAGPFEPNVNGFAVNGRLVKVTVSRLGANTSDTMTGDAELLAVRLFPKYQS